MTLPGEKFIMMKFGEVNSFVITLTLFLGNDTGSVELWGVYQIVGFFSWVLRKLANESCWEMWTKISRLESIFWGNLQLTKYSKFLFENFLCDFQFFKIYPQKSSITILILIRFQNRSAVIFLIQQQKWFLSQ